MTPDLSIFIKTTNPITTTRDAIANILRCTPATSEPDVGTIYIFDTAGISWSLFDNHGLDDDGPLKFTHYEHELDLLPNKAMSSNNEYGSFYSAAARLVASELSLSLACETLVVANLASHVATYVRGCRV